MERMRARGWCRRGGSVPGTPPCLPTGRCTQPPLPSVPAVGDHAHDEAAPRQSQHHRLHDRRDARGRVRGRLAGNQDRRRHRRVRSREHRGILRRGVLRSRDARRVEGASRRGRGGDRVLRRHRRRCGAVRDLRPGDRNMPGGDAGGVHRLRQLHGGHHARAGRCRPWNTSLGVTGTGICAAGCGLRRFRCWRWRTRRRAPATGYGPKSAARWTRTDASPSCSAAPAWWTWPARSRRSWGCRWWRGVTAAVKIVEGLAVLGISTSKRGGYAPPRPKAYTGAFSRYGPA